MKTFIGELKMPLQENDCLTFKIPGKGDRRPKATKSHFSSRDYLDFIELGIKISSDIKSARKFHMKHSPKVRFTL